MTVEYRPGLLVVNPTMPSWGPGRVLGTDGTKVTVYFKDIPGTKPEQAVRTIETARVDLELSASQSDPHLDNLPPYEKGRFLGSTRRVTFEEGLEAFGRYFPLYFEDPGYLDDPRTQERAYKVAAHRLFEETLGAGQAETLIQAGDVGELRSRFLAVENKENLLFKFEKAALRDSLQDDAAAFAFFSALIELLGSDRIEESIFESYLGALARLPAEEGKSSPFKWPVATIFPFLAQPQKHMFLKPEVTKECAQRLVFDLDYRPEPNWPTYSRLLVMSEILLERLRNYGARDLIDVQSFIWVVGRIT